MWAYLDPVRFGPPLSVTSLDLGTLVLASPLLGQLVVVPGYRAREKVTHWACLPKLTLPILDRWSIEHYHQPNRSSPPSRPIAE